MCGLVGILTKSRHGFSHKNLDLFEHLLFLDQLRGPDSTGVFCVNNIGNVSIAKEASHATDFLREPGWKNVRQDAIYNGWALIGHNRKATRGNINDANAHPFWVNDELVLVHNGTMWGDHKHIAEVEVDSEAIAHILANEPDVEKAMQKINAAYALIWYKVKEKKMHLIRNNHRPLHWCETDDMYVVSSEQGIMKFALDRTETKMVQGPYVLQEGVLETWELTKEKDTKFFTTKMDAQYKHTPPAKVESVQNFPGGTPSEVKPVTTTPSSDNSKSGGDSTTDGEYQSELDLMREIGRRLAEDALTEHEAKQAADAIIADARAPVENPPQWCPTDTFEKYLRTKEKYPTGSRVKVECRDFNISADMDKVWLTGRVEDENGFFCVFPVKKAIVDWITDPNSDEMKNKKAFFMMEVDAIGWKRTEGTPLQGRSGDWKGIVTITGKNALPVISWDEVQH